MLNQTMPLPLDRAPALRRRDAGRRTAVPAAVDVVELDGSADLRRFVALPKRLYRGDPRFVPPLERDERAFFSRKNPYVAANPTRLFLARRGGRVVGRIAATVCRAHNSYHAERAAFFGFFESAPDGEVAAALLEAAEGFAAEQKMDVLRGPYNLTTNHTCGLLVEGFDGPPLVDMPYNPPRYASFLDAAGFAKAKDLVAYWVDLKEKTPEREHLAEIARSASPRYQVREMRLSGKGLEEDMELFLDLYHEAWRNNWGFVPVDREEFAFLVERLRPALTPGLCHVAHAAGRPAGMFIGIPDFNQVLRVLNGRLSPLGIVRAFLASRRVDAARFLLTGIFNAFRGTPVAALLLHHSLEGARRRGYRGAEISWVLEDNEPATRFFVKHGLGVHRRYRLYEKRLAS